MFTSLSHFTKFTLIMLSGLSSATSSLLAQDAEPAEVAKPAAPVKAEAEELSGTIFFYNGDSISGEITRWEKDNLSIISPDLVDPVTFSAAKILNVTLNDNRKNAIKADQNEDETTLIINNRDNQQGLHGIIKGGFSNIDDKHVTLNTNYAGQIKVLKKFITKMEIDSKKGYLYRGPKSLEEWHNNSIKQTWKFTNNSLIGGGQAGNLAQDLGIPPEASISFDLSWKDDEYVTLCLFSSDHEQSKPDNYYQLSLQRGRCSLLKFSDGKQLAHLTSELQRNRGNRFRIQPRNVRGTTKELHAHYDIFMSKTKGEFHIYRNGVKLDTFTDSKPRPNKFGSALHLVSSNKTPIRIKNLSISKWSGHMPSDVDAETFSEIKGKGERILLKNGDAIVGKTGTIKDGLMNIETEFGPLKLRVTGMRTIDLSDTPEDGPKMYKSTIERPKQITNEHLINLDGTPISNI